MLDIDTFYKFIKSANVAHQQFCLWFLINNKLADQVHWHNPNHIYKNFWKIINVTLQHAWILSIARLLDPAYGPWDRKKTKPRISLDYILTKLDDKNLSTSIRKQQVQHNLVTSSLKSHKDNVESHNDANFTSTIIEAGIPNLFQWLEDVIMSIKKSEPCLNKLGVIGISFNMGFSQEGVDRIFEDLLSAKKNS